MATPTQPTVTTIAEKYNLDPMETAVQMLFDTFISENKLRDDLGAEELLEGWGDDSLNDDQRRFLMAFIDIWEAVY